jgi:copper chaperone CopZ
MKKVLVALAIMISGYYSQAQISQATLVASGLTCSMCSKAIYEALKKVNTVESIKANISESSYTIVFKKNTPVSFDDIRDAVRNAGFSVARMRVTVNFDNVEVKKDTHVAVDGINLHFLNVQPQTLNGEKTVTLLDKDYESAKDFKKYAQYTTMKCFATGVMEDCCNQGKTAERIYHVTI